jgi:hypothetical protein
LKFHINLLFELKEIDIKKFLEYSEKLDEVGRMLFGWKNKNTPQEK